MVKLLVEYGAQLDVQDYFDRTAMSFAQEYGNEEMIEFINER